MCLSLLMWAVLLLSVVFTQMLKVNCRIKREDTFVEKYDLRKLSDFLHDID